MEHLRQLKSFPKYLIDETGLLYKHCKGEVIIMRRSAREYYQVLQNNVSLRFFYSDLIRDGVDTRPRPFKNKGIGRPPSKKKEVL